MSNKTNIINVEYGENNCPADALMYDFRTRANNIRDYAKDIEFSKECIEFFKTMSDIVEESDDNICFKWNEVIEKDLPPLIVKIRKVNGKYILQYLKELGKKETLIKGKQRKGRNKNGKIEVIKEREGR